MTCVFKLFDCNGPAGEARGLTKLERERVDGKPYDKISGFVSVDEVVDASVGFIIHDGCKLCVTSQRVIHGECETVFGVTGYGCRRWCHTVHVYQPTQSPCNCDQPRDKAFAKDVRAHIHYEVVGTKSVGTFTQIPETRATAYIEESVARTLEPGMLIEHKDKLFRITAVTNPDECDEVPSVTLVEHECRSNTTG